MKMSKNEKLIKLFQEFNYHAEQTVGIFADYLFKNGVIIPHRLTKKELEKDCTK